MKKRIVTLALVVALVAIAAVGTLAYFTDTDKADNVFTTGNVKIDLIENYEQNSKLIPSTGSAQQGTLKNGITKEVTVKNVGTEKAYVRVHIAIPSILDNGAETFDAGKNVLHFNYPKDSIGEGKWDWSDSATDNKYEGSWNYYETEINDIKYNVYVVTYGTALEADQVTAEKAMHQVYLDTRVTSDDYAKLIEALGENWHMYVVAEGTQADGFENAYDALNTAFGKPGTYTVDWTVVAD